jgi:hypothetical protein
MKDHSIRSLVLVAAMAATLSGCGGGSGTSTATEGPAAAPSPTPVAGLQFTSYQAPAVSNVNCISATNSTAAITRVQFAQTVLLDTSHPLFYLSAGRDTGIRVSVTGSGTAPDVQVTAQANGTTLGTVCLAGPSTLPASVDESTPSPATSFVGNLPAAWVVPGLQLTLKAGNASKVIGASELKIGPQPVLSLVTADWLLWGDTQATPLPANFGKEYAAKLPVSSIQHSVFPLTLSMAQLPIGPRGDGHSPAGATINSPAVMANGKSHCSSSDASAGTCTAWSGYGILSAVLSLTGQIRDANGLSSSMAWYGALGKNSSVGGGLGGGGVGSGDDYGLTFNHEFGHGFDQPHWGDSLYTRTAAGATQVHPYTGQYLNGSGQPNGGGVGASWAFDPLQSNNPFVNPVCAATGKERQEPMQRSGNACVPAGETYDFASDYASLFVARYFNGAANPYAGNVASPRDQTGNLNPPFSFPKKGGRDNLVLNGTSLPKFMHWNEGSASYVDQASTDLSYQVNYPQQWDVPVYTLWGAFSNATPAVTTILQPLKYRGGLPRVFDPTNAADFAALKASAASGVFWWGADLVVRADFDNGTTRYALVRTSARGTDPLNGNSFSYWAVNLPAIDGARLVKVSLYNRPMEVRYGDGGSTSSSYYTATNLNSTLNANLTAGHYMDTATLVGSLTLSGL